jgi:hypothetical protein
VKYPFQQSDDFNSFVSKFQWHWIGQLSFWFRDVVKNNNVRTERASELHHHLSLPEQISLQGPRVASAIVIHKGTYEPVCHVPGGSIRLRDALERQRLIPF